MSQKQQPKIELKHFCSGFVESLEEDNITKSQLKEFFNYCELFSDPFKQSQVDSLFFINRFCSQVSEVLSDSDLSEQISQNIAFSLCQLFISVFDDNFIDFLSISVLFFLPPNSKASQSRKKIYFKYQTLILEKKFFPQIKSRLEEEEFKIPGMLRVILTLFNFYNEEIEEDISMSILKSTALLFDKFLKAQTISESDFDDLRVSFRYLSEFVEGKSLQKRIQIWILFIIQYLSPPRSLSEIALKSLNNVISKFPEACSLLEEKDFFNLIPTDPTNPILDYFSNIFLQVFKDFEIQEQTFKKVWKVFSQIVPCNFLIEISDLILKSYFFFWMSFLKIHLVILILYFHFFLTYQNLLGTHFGPKVFNFLLDNFQKIKDNDINLFLSKIFFQIL